MTIPMLITEDTIIEFVTEAGRPYDFSASGDFGGGSIALQWNDREEWTSFPDCTLTSDAFRVVTAPTNKVRFAVTGSTGPHISANLVPARSEPVSWAGANVFTGGNRFEGPLSIPDETAITGLSAPRFLFASIDFNNANIGLLIAGSADGVNFDIAGGAPVYVNPSNEVQLRDPSIVRWQGIYYVAYTRNAFDADPSVKYGIIKSPDLIHWTPVGELNIDANLGVTGGTRAWAPEWFTDQTTGLLYLLFTASTTGASNQTQHPFIAPVADPGNIASYGPAVALGGDINSAPTAGNGYYDVQIFQYGGYYCLIIKHLTSANLVIYRSSTLTGAYTAWKSGNFMGIGTNVEGPCVVSLGGGKWRVYYVDTLTFYTRYVDTSDDFTTWSSPLPINSGLTRMNQGTILRVTDYAGLRDLAFAMGYHRNTAATSVRTSFSNANYFATTCDRYLAQIGTLSASRTVTLPSASTYPADMPFTVNDESGSVTGSNKILIARAGTDTLNGGTTSLSITQPYAGLTLRTDGVSKWFTSEVPLNGTFSGASSGTNTGDNVAATLSTSGTAYKHAVLVQAVDQTVTNSSTLVTSTDLTCTLAPGTYAFRLDVALTVTSITSAGSRVSFNFSGTASSSSLLTYRSVPVALNADNTSPSYSSGDNALPYGSSSQDRSFNGTLIGQLVVTVSGDLRFQFAESAASAGNSVTLKKGSMLVVDRLS
ncbi:hypothetical protein BH09VER1_BH09VER1_48450 [soil metagenome]